jgi:hypothetical protein
MTDQEKLAIAETNKEISTKTILQDIADTKAEIVTMEREIQGYRLIGDKMSHFRADARVSGIKERQEFISKLEVILEIRNRQSVDTSKHSEDI